MDGSNVEMLFRDNAYGEYTDVSGLAVVPLSRPRPPMFRRGHTNTDNTLDMADAVFTLSYLFADGSAPTCLDAADTNDDGVVDIADAIAVLSHLLAGSGDLPGPFGECGVDPTEDELGCAAYPGCE